MRILHILDHSIPLNTRYAEHALSVLKTHRARGWETVHITGPNQGRTTADEEQIEGWHFYRTHRPGGLLEGLPGLEQIEWMGEIAHRIEQVVKRHRPHILHAHSPMLNVIPALRVGRRVGIPVVCEIHDPTEGPSAEDEVSGMRIRRNWFWRRMETWALARADAITTDSKIVHAELLSRGIALEKISLIPGESDNQEVSGSRYEMVYANIMEPAFRP